MDSPDKQFDPTSESNLILRQEDPKITLDFHHINTNVNYVRLTPALGANAEAVEAVMARRRSFIVDISVALKTRAKLAVQMVGCGVVGRLKNS